MPKPLSLHSDEYKRFLKLLVEARKASRMTQTELARRMGKPQSYVSKCELGERQVNAVELVTICRAIGVPFVDFAAQLEVAVFPKQK